MSCQEPAQYQYPVLDDGFTPNEIHELFSLFQSEPPVHSTSGSQTIHTNNSAEETRKRKRMISNRESARRSRWRKKMQLENLIVEVNRLKLVNQELKNRLCTIKHESHFVLRESNGLIVESLDLQQNLVVLYEILSSMQLQ
ncbi:basic leucine zipper 4 [Olea europaea var. sylvestris]|uniref:basic leucine zipper 4 n=1 Tax=Olea europaea var. sylvestris TaxID=158386 RepID=UPI000C1D894A|nr:basic leucine zipper 4 [Olea europaea var. sylvestris]